MPSLTIDRDFDADPTRVWTALTDSGELAQWFWPPRLATSVETDVRPGGRYRIASEVGEMAVAGEYRAVEPPQRLSGTWRWDGEDADTVVTIDLRPTATGTRLRLVHDGFADAEARDVHAQGWQDCLERLPAHLATTAAAADG